MKLLSPNRLRSKTLSLAAASLFAVSFAAAPFGKMAYACAFDFTKPERTAIDWILEANTLVLARPDPNNLFSYKTIEVLRGQENGHDIPFLVDSVSKRALANNSNDAVLFAQDNADQWTKVAYIDDNFKTVLDQTLASSDIWRDSYTPDRFTAFEALQNDENPTLRALSIRELDKAPYEMLREIKLQIPAENLIADLWTPAGYPYQPIRVLLLGLSGEDIARDEIYGYFARTQNWEWVNNIGAFSAALIELDGIAGVDHLEQALLTGHSQPLDKLQGVVSALAVHRAVASPGLREAIDQALAKMVGSRPETAPLVAQQFAVFSDWSQVKPLAKLVQEQRLKTTADLMVVSVYLAQARGFDKATKTAPEKG